MESGNLRIASKQGFAAFPPEVTHTDILGYVEEANGIFHSRDIGRGFALFGKIYLMFGDTFCNDSNGKFVGLANNTVAIIEDTDQPLKSKYLEVEKTGFIKPLIPLTTEEKQLNENNESRVVLWAFGGVVEMKDGTGRLWYQKSIDHGNGNVEYIGTGIAKIIENGDGQPIAERIDELIFGPNEPRMGTFTAIAEGAVIYLYGDRPDGKIVLARVCQNLLEKKAEYLYWDGKNWVQEMGKAAVVIENMQQGAVMRSRLFGEDRPFLFVGTSKCADSKVIMGASDKLEGPWKLEAVCVVDGIKESKSNGEDKWMYCIYPQFWASNEENAQLMLTWSEKCPGGVVIGKIKLLGLVENDRGS